MENEVKTGIEINFFRFFRLLMKKWWLVAVFALSFAVGGAASGAVSYKPQYTSKVVFISSNRNEGEITGSISSGDVTASSTLNSTFKYILTSDEFLTDVIRKSGANYSVRELRSNISIVVPADTLILELGVTTPSAQTSFAVARAIETSYAPYVESVKNTNLEIFSGASAASAPDSNSDVAILGVLGFFIGVAVSVIIIVLSDLSRATIRSQKDIQTELGLSVIGRVGHIKKDRRKGKKRSLLITDLSTGFGFIEAYKIIRTKIEILAGKKGYKTIMVTSASENEGKTTVAVNLAIALGQNGKSVLLVDGDLRKPAVAKALSISTPESRSVLDVIKGRIPANEAVRFIKRYGIYVLASGIAGDNASELLSGQKAGELFRSLKESFDYVIVDTAPVNVVTDSIIVAGYSDSVLLVVRDDATPVSFIQDAVSAISDSGTPILGSVYNNVEKTSSAGGYGGYSGYGYGKKQGYGYN